ncbi:MAG: PKD domain-containing protein [Acidobacteriota bacterium]
MRIALHTLAAAGLAALAAGCTVQNTTAPPLAGPSEFALSLAIQAVPDSIVQDGASQSSVSIEARGPDGRPVRALALRAEMRVNGVVQDFGTLSARTVVTGEDGRARLTYTAPPQPVESTGTGNIVSIFITPIGGDYRGEASRQVDIRLIPPGVIIPPNGAPVPSFVVTPTPVTTFTNVTFDASGTTDEGVPCGGACAYRWTFGDGGSASGQIVTYQYRTAGTFTATLTVTDARGTTASTSQSVSVTASAAPTASFTFSPTTPATSQDIFFNASASRPAAGRTIVSYQWNFGSGSTAQGVTVTKRYDTPGTYNVTLNVTDDANQVGTVTQSVTVGGTGTGPQPVFTFSPTNPDVNTTIFFDASATRGPTAIVEYRFTWGDNTPDTVGSSPIAQHRFATAGTYTVRLTVRDTANRIATTTQSVTVSATPTQLVPSLSFSPTNPRVGTVVNFNASSSTGPNPITQYEFNFGDGSAAVIGTSPTTTHTFTTAATYNVRLTIRDSAGGVAAVTVTVTVSP